MVDLALLQSVSYIVGALGVGVAAIYYVINLREQRRNRRIALTQSLIETLKSVEDMKAHGELMNMEWKDYDDFEKKYGSNYNLDNFAKRMHFFYIFEGIGGLLKAGLVDADTLYPVVWRLATFLWFKFQPTIAENRRRYTGKDGWSGFEYLVNELMRIKKQRDPDYVVAATGIKYIPDK